MVKTRKRRINRTLFYVRRSIIRWAVMFLVGLFTICAAVLILEDPDARFILEMVLAFFAVLWVCEKFYIRKDDEE